MTSHQEGSQIRSSEGTCGFVIFPLFPVLASVSCLVVFVLPPGVVIRASPAGTMALSICKRAVVSVIAFMTELKSVRRLVRMSLVRRAGVWARS